MKKILAGALLITACTSEVLAPTPEALGLTASEDVLVVTVSTDTSFAKLRLEVEPPQCVGPDGSPDPRLEVDGDQLFRLGEDGRLRPAARSEFVVGIRIRVWWHPDECQTPGAAALLPQ